MTCKAIRVGFAGRESIASQGTEKDMVELAKSLTDTCRKAQTTAYYYVVRGKDIVWTPND